MPDKQLSNALQYVTVTKQHHASHINPTCYKCEKVNEIPDRSSRGAATRAVKRRHTGAEH